jgi:hypothetical protein
MARQTTRKSPVTTSATSRTSTAPKATRKTPAMPNEQDIRVRAYEIFLRRNGGPGDAHSDWVQAERELKEERTPRR